MYHLVNTMTSTEANHVGRHISSHDTQEEAEKAQTEFDAKFEPGSYVPTTIVSEDDGYYLETGDVWRRPFAGAGAAQS